MHVTISSLMLSMVWSECKNYLKFLRNVRGSLSFGSNVSGFLTSSSPTLYKGPVLTSFRIQVIRLPADHFIESDRRRSSTGTNRMGQPLVVVIRNLLAVRLFLAGVLMLFTPGQGALMILLALSVASFPDKDRLERRLIAFPGVLATLNMICIKGGKPPLEKPLVHEQEKT